MAEERKNPIARKKLLETAKSVLAIARRFVLQLSGKGITEEYLNRFEADITSAEEMKTNEALRKETGAITALVKKKCKECYKWGVSVKKAMMRAFGKESPVQDEFPNHFSDYRQDEAEMINVMPHIFAVAEKYAAELAPKGITADEITKGRALLAELDDLNSTQQNKFKTNESYTAERNIAQLKVYDTINEINIVGREVFDGDPVNLKFFESPWRRRGSSNGDEEKPEDEGIAEQ